MKKKRILIISCVFTPETVVSAQISNDISNALSIKHDVTVLCPRPSRPYGFVFDVYKPNETQYERHTLNSYVYPKSKLLGRMWESIDFGLKAIKYIFDKKGKFDIVYLNTWPIFSPILIIAVAKYYGIKAVIHTQDIYPESLINRVKYFRKALYKGFLKIDKYCLENSDHILCISPSIKSYLIESRSIEPKKITYVYNWQDEQVFKCNKFTTSDTFTFMYLGNIGPVSDLEYLVKCFIKMNLKLCRLVIAGSGSCKEGLMQLVKQNNSAVVEFWDVPTGKVAEIQSMADVLLLPQKKNTGDSSIPSKLPAYLFSKKPILSIVDDDSAVAHIVRTSNCGFVVAPRNSTELNTSFNNILRMSNDELSSYGKNGYEYGIKHFSKRENLQKVVNVFDLVLRV